MATTSAMKTVVILPAYNEEGTVSATIEDFHRELPEAEIWVVNNRSSDTTELLAKNTLSRLGCKGGILREMMPGKGNAIRRAFLDLDADVYVLADADLTYPARHVHDLIAPIIMGQADMSVGDRHSTGSYAAGNKRILHGFGNQLVRVLVNLLFKASLADIMSGYRVFNRRFVKGYPILVAGFEVETDMTLHALDKRLRIYEVPVEYHDRPFGSFSKLSTVRDGIRVISTIATIFRCYRPLFFFGCAALVFSACGLIAGLPVLEDWLQHRYIYHVPLAILATAFELMAIVLVAIGLILDAIAHEDKRRFEIDLLHG